MKSYLTQIISVVMVFFCTVFVSLAAEEGIVSVTVLPFEDRTTGEMNTDISSTLRQTLSENKYIACVPASITLSYFQTLEPSYMWGEKKDGQKQGGIVWQFKTFPVARARATLPADFIVHGDTIGSGEGRVVNIHLREFSRSEPVRTITLTVWSEEEFMAGLETAAGRIGSWIIRAKAIDLSEELIREYLAGLIGYGDAVTELRRLADLDSSSMPVFALLLDLQKRHVVGNDRDLIETGEKVIALYDPKVGEDTRYLLSLDLDPYDITASVYERWAEWSEAIKLRKLAFQRYPFGRAAHEQKIGMAYLQQGISFEKKGRVDDAMDSFINAMTHLPEQSEPYISAKEAFERLQGHK